MEFSRRDLLTKSLVAFGTASVGAVASVCGPTARQGEGPYFPEKDLNRDNDLVTLKPGDKAALGEVIVVTGQVLNVDCRPIAGAQIGIWQAAASGRYNHSQDHNALPLDPNFQYWGRFVTKADGKYQFQTVIPGHYPLDPSLVGKPATGPGQYRPPHIHFRVNARGYQTLTTQMYFDPKSYDDSATGDLVSDLNRWEGVDSTLTVRFSVIGKAAKTGAFDLVLRTGR